ncbi:hypothetical protein JKF63_06648 [Porcisia hertigi]|uniref:Uncharacterized protein n=1 Tax=Porcisia hertigi TaxID=2761500 RepID=A0A836IZB7_9TRYP|nr:hypothetical protein JKF63_06648 [Porcisia hertigi]
MVAWGPLQRQLMAYIVRHPLLQQAVRNAGKRVVAHPTFQKAKQSAYSFFERTGTKAAHVVHDPGAKAGTNSRESTFNRWRRGVHNTWHKHKAGMISFIVANFMGILVFIQVSPMLWHSMRRGIHYLTEATPSAGAERKEKPRKRKAETSEEQLDFKVEAPSESIRDAILQNIPPPQDDRGRGHVHGRPASGQSQPWQTSSSLFDDTLGSKHESDAGQVFDDIRKDMFRNSDGSAQVNFDTSFLVKMGEETTFTSSLEREVLTGGVYSRS